MKVAAKLIFLFNDADGFGTAISDALQPNPSATLHRLEDSFELSLEGYGIKDHKVTGKIVNFVDYDGLYQVSVVLMQHYGPPVLACAINEVLSSIKESLPIMPTIVLPIIVAASKLKLEGNYSPTSDKVSLYGVQIGPETDITRAMAVKTREPPLSLQVHHEPLACFLQLARVLELPTCVLIGQSSELQIQKTSGEELKVINEMEDLLTSMFSLCFLRERITWNPTKTTKDDKEPWRALYG